LNYVTTATVRGVKGYSIGDHGGFKGRRIIR